MYEYECVFVLFECAGDHQELHVLTYSFPTRLSSDLGRIGRRRLRLSRSNRREVAARRDQSPPLTTHSCRSGAGRELSMMGGIRRSALGRDRLSQRPPDRKSTRLNSSHSCASRMPPSA